MKRIILLILAPALSLTAAFSLTSCDALNNGKPNPPADENGANSEAVTPEN